MKLLSEIQYNAEESKRQVTKTQQAHVATFQLSEATQATTGCEYILTIPDTQQVSTQAVQPSQAAAPQPPTVIAKLQPQRSSSASSQPASFLVVDDQQSGPSRQLIFALSPTKTLTRHRSPDKLKTVSTTVQNYQVFSGVFHLYCSIIRMTHHNHAHPLNFNQHRHQCILPLSKNKQDFSASPANRVSPNQQISLH